MAAEDVVLEWTGDDTHFLMGVPARDLTEADVDWEAYKATAGTLPDTSDGVSRGSKGFAEAFKAASDRLEASGMYKPVKKQAVAKEPKE